MMKIFFLFFILFVSVFGEESEEFIEVNVKKIYKDSQIKFGAGIQRDLYEWNREQMKQFGPVFKLAYWQTVWEVSGAAPAPHNADEEQMDRWINSIYWVISETEVLQNTSKLLTDEKIDVITAAMTPPNSYFATPGDIKRRQKKIENAKEGEEFKPDDEEYWRVIMEEKEKEDKADQFNLMISESVTDFGKFWAASINYLEKLDIALPFLELTWEPDSKEFVYFVPSDYAASIKAVRDEARKRGIKDDQNRIVGPGTSSPSSAKEYIEAIVKDKETYDAVQAWSFHVKDQGGSMEEIEKELLEFKKILKTTVPKSWTKKPTIITSFSYVPSNNIAFGDVEFNGDLKKCYTKIYGILRKGFEDLPNTMGQSPKIAVRILANLLMQFSHGFSQTIYKDMADVNWSYSCSGLYDRQNRRKQLHLPLSSFLKHIPEDAKVVKKQWKNHNNCVVTILKSSSRFVVAIANSNDSPCTRSFSLSGLPTKRITEGFTLSYNNGTVSLGAESPYEALLLRNSLEYDIFEDEESVNKNELVEFDLAIGPHASAIAILEISLTEIKADIPEETDSKSSTAHMEL